MHRQKSSWGGYCHPGDRRAATQGGQEWRHGEALVYATSSLGLKVTGDFLTKIMREDKIWEQQTEDITGQRGTQTTQTPFLRKRTQPSSCLLSATWPQKCVTTQGEGLPVHLCQLEHLGPLKLFPCSSNDIPPRHQRLLFMSRDSCGAWESAHSLANT